MESLQSHVAGTNNDLNNTGEAREVNERARDSRKLGISLKTDVSMTTCAFQCIAKQNCRVAYITTQFNLRRGVSPPHRRKIS